MAHPNEEIVRRGYEAFLSGDMAAMDELLADDIVWHAPGHNQMAGDFRGKEAVMAQFAKVFELTGGNFQLEMHDVLANDEHVVVLARATGKIGDRTLDDRGVQLFHVKDGKATEQWLYPGDQHATDEFWG
jgi:ketosteroid isomerase-like protein